MMMMMMMMIDKFNIATTKQPKRKHKNRKIIRNDEISRKKNRKNKKLIFMI